MKHGTAYGKEAAKYAKALIGQGWTNDEIRAVSVCENIPPETLRRWRFRMKAKNETANETLETPQNDAETPTTEQVENPSVNAENTVSTVSKTLHSVSTLTKFRREFAATFHPADLIPYGCVSVACVGVSATLPGIGLVVSALYFAVFAVALHYLKVRGAWFDIAFMVLLEVVVGFPAHLSWANEALWANVTALPIDVSLASYRNADTGKIMEAWMGSGTKTPFIIACYTSAVLVLFGAYGVACSVIANKNGKESHI